MPNFVRCMSRLLVILKRPLLAIFLMLLLQAVAGLVVVIAPGITPLSIALLAVDAVICLASLAIFRRGQYTPSSYVPSSTSPGQDLCGLLGCIFGIIALDLMTELLAIPNLMEEQMIDICLNPWSVVAIALAAPLGEELLFRWGIMGHLLHRNMSVPTSIFVSALLFGVIHLNPAQVFFATAMGVLLGILYWKSGNILLPVLLHILNNSVACAQVWLLGDDIHTFNPIASLGGPTVAWSTVAVCTALCVGIMWRYAKSNEQ